MPDYNKLRDICEDFIDNIDGWCEFDDGDMIDKSLSEMQAALLSVESTEKSTNPSSFQLPSLNDVNAAVKAHIAAVRKRGGLWKEITDDIVIEASWLAVKKLGNKKR